MSVDDHGLEVLKKAGLDVGLTPKVNYAIQVVGKDGDPLPVSADVQFVTQNTLTNIYNVTCTNANTEYSQALPAKTVGFILKSRQLSNIKLGYTSGESITNYVSIPTGCVYENINFRLAQTIYFNSDVAGAILEIVADYNI